MRPARPSLRRTERGPVSVLALSGAAGEELCSALEREFKVRPEGVRAVVLSLETASFVPGYAWGIVLHAHKKLAASGIALVLTGVRGIVAASLASVRDGGALRREDDAETTIASLGGSPPSDADEPSVKIERVPSGRMSDRPRARFGVTDAGGVASIRMLKLSPSTESAEPARETPAEPVVATAGASPAASTPATDAPPTAPAQPEIVHAAAPERAFSAERSEALANTPPPAAPPDTRAPRRPHAIARWVQRAADRPAVLALDTSVDSSTWPAVEAALRDAPDGAHWIVDLTGADYVSSVGWGGLLAWRARRADAESDLVVCGLNPGLMMAYSLYGFGNRLPAYPDRSTAEDALAQNSARASSARRAA